MKKPIAKGKVKKAARPTNVLLPFRFGLDEEMKAAPRRHRRPTSLDEIWTRADGTRIAVSDMSEEHVRAALRMILRKARTITAHQALRRALERVTKAEGWNDE